jgi:hypothetical protein
VNPNTGAVLIAIGVFFLLILNVQWGEIDPMVRAYSVLGAGLVCLAAFATVQGATGDGALVTAELAHQVSGAAAAAIILGSLFASLGGFPFWNLMDGGMGEEARRDLDIQEELVPGERAKLSLSAVSVELEMVTWGRPEVGVNGTISVYGSSVEKAEEYLNQTVVRMVRDSNGDIPEFQIEVDAPGAGSSLGFRGYRLFITIKVPTGLALDLDLDCVSGDYTISDLLIGDALVKTVSGDVVIDDIAGDILRVSTVSGEIDGAITFTGANLNTISGNIDIAVGEKSGTYEFKSTSGNVDFTVPGGDIGLSLEASTVSGRVVFDAEGLEYTEDKRSDKVAETAGYSGKAVKIEIEGSTISGNIRVDS